MARGKVKPVARKCRCCGAINEENSRGIKGGLCYRCRKSRHERVGAIVSRAQKFRLTVVLSVISVFF
jgi:hypothetical protein